MVYVCEYDTTDSLCEREATTYWLTSDKCTDTGDGDSYIVSSMANDSTLVVRHFADSDSCSGTWTQHDLRIDECATAGRMRVRMGDTTEATSIVDCRVGWCTYPWPRVPRFPQLPANARIRDGTYVSDLPPLPPHAACWAVALLAFVVAVLLLDRRCTEKGQMSDE
jgi:hypothetical protein